MTYDSYDFYPGLYRFPYRSQHEEFPFDCHRESQEANTLVVIFSPHTVMIHSIHPLTRATESADK